MNGSQDTDAISQLHGSPRRSVSSSQPIKKNHRNKMNTEWSIGYFVGINGKTTEYLVATADGVFSCATIRRLPDDEACDPECINIVKVTYRDYVLRGASLTPMGVRFGETHAKNVQTIPLRPQWCPEEPGASGQGAASLG